MDNIISWNDLRLPEIESDEDLDRRLNDLKNGVDTRMTIGGRRLTPMEMEGYTPTANHARIISAFTALGVSPNEISEIMQIPLDILKKYYLREITVASSLANAAVAHVALDMATSGQSAEMTKFWLRTRAGWREAPRSVEISGPGGKAIEIDSARAKLANVLEIDTATGEITDEGMNDL